MFVSTIDIRGHFDIYGLLTACSLLKRKSTFRLVQLYNQTLIAPQNVTQKVIKAILQEAFKVNSSCGVGVASDIAAQAEEAIKLRIDENQVRTILSIHPDFQCLDKDGGWFWSPSAPRNRLVTLIRKILSVSPHIEISELRAGVSRDDRLQVAPPRRVLLELCRNLSWCQVDGMIVKADPDLDWDSTFTRSNEWVIWAVLKEYGPVMSRSELEKRCNDMGVKEASFYGNLSYSPIIKRLAQGVYGLRGANISPVVIESLKEEANRHRRSMVDFGWTNEGKVWLARILSEGAIRSGVISIPAVMRQHVQGVYKLMAPDDVILGLLKIKDVNVWGLGPYFRRRGGEPGDYLIIILDIHSLKAKVYIGDEELVDEFISNSQNSM